ncbi:putative lysozyme-like protein [Oryza brachyantha]|uniref:putative lysozyme-like protein n=1 Tax=Oryza brachyantha TaxID=4533 RepID=UPI001ADBC574|nr:putative lysozyme-like protein [Oryza brachyantha]
MRGSLEVHAIGRDAASPCALRLKALPALDMMRYQRLSPDCLPLANGGGGGSGSVTRKPASRSCKDDDGGSADGSRLAPYLPSPQLDSKPLRARAPQLPSSSATWSPARDRDRDHAHYNHHPSDSSDTASPSSNGGGGGAGTGGDVLLQWGHNKRSRCRRDSSAVSSANAAPSSQRRQTAASAVKIQRRSSAPAEKLMPLPPPSTTGSYTRGSNLRSASSFSTRSAAAGEAHPHRSAAEERSGGGGHRRSPDKAHKSALDAVLQMDSKNNHHHHHHHHDSLLAANGGTGAAEKLGGVERFELPRIYISLSRKEKEDDFLAMKGTKLPQRPKKRAKNVDKTLQYVFPGMWLSDLTKGRYEVREKKCVKKRRRGLKGMESMDSDSE